MKPEERIALLRKRHVEAINAGVKGRINLRRIQHVEVALGEERLRNRGYKLHVVQNPNQTNFCPFFHESKAVLTCLVRSTNVTDPVCFRCEYPADFAKARSHLQEHDVRKQAHDWQPQVMMRYVNGSPVSVAADPWAYLRVEAPNGDVLWYKRFADGTVEPDYGARIDNNRDTRWWDLTDADLAPLPSHLPEEDVERLAAKAQRKRTLMLRGGTEDKPTKKRVKKDDAEPTRKKRK